MRDMSVTKIRHCQGCPWYWKEAICLHPKAREKKPFPGCVDYETEGKPIRLAKR